MTVDLSYAIGLPPGEAISYLTAKANVPVWNWWDQWQEQQVRAFTVAKAAKLDLVEEVRAAVEKAIEEGKPFKEFAAEIEPLLQRRGWWGVDPITGAVLGTPSRLEIIYRTNMQNAYMAGRFRQFKANAERRPYWQYIAVLDNRTRPAHAALNGKVFRHDDPFWKTHHPPLGFNCRCRVRALTAEQVKQKGLTVEVGAGNMKQKTVEVGGEERAVTGWTDSRGRVRYTDPGWSYNPGEQEWAGR